MCTAFVVSTQAHRETYVGKSRWADEVVKPRQGFRIGASHDLAETGISLGERLTAYVDPLLGAEAVEHFVVERDECGEELAAGPGVARVVFGGEAAFGEVDGDAVGAGGEASADIFLTLFDEVGFEGGLGVVWDGGGEGV